MTEREKELAAAAIRVFSRYGVKRATMSDIADEAGVVRQTLYNVFPGKDAVLRGTIRYFVETQWRATHEGWAGAETLSDRLDILFRHFVEEPWDTINATPDAEDLERGVNAAGRDEIAKLKGTTDAYLRELFLPYEDALSQHGQTAESTAKFLHNAMSGVKHGAQNRDELQSYIASLKAAVLALAGTS